MRAQYLAMINFNLNLQFCAPKPVSPSFLFSLGLTVKISPSGQAMAGPSPSSPQDTSVAQQRRPLPRIAEFLAKFYPQLTDDKCGGTCLYQIYLWCK